MKLKFKFRSRKPFTSKFTSRFCFLARIVKSYKISEYFAFGNLFLMWESREIWPLVPSWNKRRGSLKCTSVSTGHRLEKNSDLDRPQSSGTNSLIFIRFLIFPGEHVWSKSVRRLLNLGLFFRSFYAKIIILSLCPFASLLSQRFSTVFWPICSKSPKKDVFSVSFLLVLFHVTCLFVQKSLLEIQSATGIFEVRKRERPFLKVQFRDFWYFFYLLFFRFIN